MCEETICTVIPAYNAALTLKQVVLELLQQPLTGKNIVVVNDGSTDNTRAIVRQLPVQVVHHVKRMGKGEALKSGFRFALNTRATRILTLDADGQHQPREAIQLIEASRQNGADIVIGSRMSTPDAMPKHRILSNTITSTLISWRIKQRLDDTQSGFRLIRASVLETIDLERSHFDLESELLLKAGLQGFSITTTPVSAIYRADIRSLMRFADVSRFVSLFLKSLSWRSITVSIKL